MPSPRVVSASRSRRAKEGGTPRRSLPHRAAAPKPRFLPSDGKVLEFIVFLPVAFFGSLKGPSLDLKRLDLTKLAPPEGAVNHLYVCAVPRMAVGRNYGSWRWLIPTIPHDHYGKKTFSRLPGQDWREPAMGHEMRCCSWPISASTQTLPALTWLWCRHDSYFGPAGWT